MNLITEYEVNIPKEVSDKFQNFIKKRIKGKFYNFKKDFDSIKVRGELKGLEDYLPITKKFEKRLKLTSLFTEYEKKQRLEEQFTKRVKLVLERSEEGELVKKTFQFYEC